MARFYSRRNSFTDKVLGGKMKARCFVFPDLSSALPGEVGELLVLSTKVGSLTNPSMFPSTH